jgi:hypothetical protein
MGRERRIRNFTPPDAPIPAPPRQLPAALTDYDRRCSVAADHGRDELSRVWEDRFQATYGVLRDEVLTTFDEYLNCGLLAHGAARVYCDAC